MDFSQQSNSFSQFSGNTLPGLNSQFSLQAGSLQDPLNLAGGSSLLASSANATQLNAFTTNPLTPVNRKLSLALTGGLQNWQQGSYGLGGQPEHEFRAPTGFGVTASQRGDEFGSAVATGDFNGDGYMDLAVGSPNEDAPRYGEDQGVAYDDLLTGSGMVSVIYGSASGLSATAGPGNQILQVQGTSQFGYDLASGDFNDDGHTDLAVATDGGSAHIIYGSKQGLDEQSRMTGGRGQSLAVGDFNRDGLDDLAIGNPSKADKDGHRNAGSVSVYYSYSMTDVVTGTEIGFSSPEDWSQDSQAILGAAEGDKDGDFSNFPGKNVNPEFDSDNFGFSLASGDFNGDGADDLAIGVPGEQLNAPGGAVNVIYGSEFGLTYVGNQFWDQNGTEGSQFDLVGGVEGGDQFGYALEAGDFNRDGIEDLAVGVPGEDSDSGAVSIIYGHKNIGLTKAGNQLIDQNTPGIRGGKENNDRFGATLAASDFNNDGAVDLVVGVPVEGDGRTRGGAVSILYGTNSGFGGFDDLLQQNYLPGNDFKDGDLFGAALTAGDFNGDGSNDLAIGAPGEKVSDSAVYNHAGMVNVLYGRRFFPYIGVTTEDTLLQENQSNSARFTFNSSNPVRQSLPVTLQSVGTAKLGVDFSVSGASVNGDLITVTFPENFNGVSSVGFEVLPINDAIFDPNETIRFNVVKGAGYIVGESNQNSLTIQDDDFPVVDTLVDENDGNFTAGDVSLREAIWAAGNEQTINFAPNLVGTIVLDSQLVIEQTLTINGNGADRLSVSGNNTSRVFEIRLGANVGINGLTIRNGAAMGDSGGGIANYGNLTLSNSIVSDNIATYGGGIHNTSTGILNLDNSTLKNNRATQEGGGILNESGNVNITWSTLDSNTSGQNGAGVANIGTLRITNSTLSNNRTGRGWNGGALYQELGSTTLINSTISGNESGYGGGIRQTGGYITINFSTIANNTAMGGGGIHRHLAYGTTTIGNSIIAGNRMLYNLSSDVYGNFNSQGYNLISDITGSSGFGGNGDQVGYGIDAKLGPLNNNGGPTRTHALLPGSPANDAFNANFGRFSPSGTDQRGKIRLPRGQWDIGAFESN